MRTNIFLWLLLFLSYNAYPQAFTDAQAIEKDTVTTSPAVDANGAILLVSNLTTYQLLKNYFPSGVTTGQIDTLLLTNPFLHMATPYIKSAPVPAAVKEGLIKTSFPALSFLGGLDVTNVVNGIAQFMIKRAEQELTITFFDRFKDFANQHVEFKILFPNTVDVLDNLLTYQYPNMISVLRTAFLSDLSNLPGNIQSLLAVPQYQAFFNKYPEFAIAIKTLGLVQQISTTKANLADVIHQFAGLSEWGTPNSSTAFKDFANAVELGDILSQSVVSVGNSTSSWISPTDFINQARDPMFLQVYVGLIYQEVVTNNITFGKTTFASILHGISGPKGPLALMRTEMTNFLQLGQQASQQLSALISKRAANTPLTNDDYYDLINTSINAIEFGFDIARFFGSNVDIHSYTQMARDGDNIYRAIYQKQYPQAITSSMDFLSTLVQLIGQNSSVGAKIIADLNTVLSRGGRRDSITITATSLADIPKSKWKVIEAKAKSSNLPDADAAALQSALQYKKFTELSKLITRLTDYGMFIANVMNAQHATDVENVIENSAMPVGSSSVKKNSLFTIQIQSYLGGYYRIDNPRITYNSTWTDRLGIAAPIGIGFNFGLKNGGSIGLLANLLDIGAIVDYQLKVDTTTANSSGATSTTIDKNYQVKLGQILSPGVFIVYGLFHNLPVSVGVGAQYGPGLGKINANASEVVNNPSWRCNAFLAVDIPFFSILNVKFAHPKP